MKINLTFSTNYSVEEIVKEVNKYIIEHIRDIELNLDRTEIPEHRVKWTLCSEPSNLWEDYE